MKSKIGILTVANYNKRVLNNKKDEFFLLFNLHLDKYLAGNMITLITGFDIIGFDKDIKTPDGTSVKIYVKQKYGKKAEKLISWLIQNTGLPPKERKNK